MPGWGPCPYSVLRHGQYQTKNSLKNLWPSYGPKRRLTRAGSSLGSPAGKGHGTRLCRRAGNNSSHVPRHTDYWVSVPPRSCIIRQLRSFKWSGSLLGTWICCSTYHRERTFLQRMIDYCDHTTKPGSRVLLKQDILLLKWLPWKLRMNGKFLSLSNLICMP